MTILKYWGVLSLIPFFCFRLFAVPVNLRVAFWICWFFCLVVMWAYDQYSPSNLGKRAVRQRWKRERQQSIEIPSELLRMLYGDRETAHRLLSAVQQANRGKSARWCAEKVIHDLERDRM